MQPVITAIRSDAAGRRVRAPEQTRRALLMGALGNERLPRSCSDAAVRAGEDPPGSDERPQRGDLLVFSEGDHEGKLITAVRSAVLGGPPVHAWPKDPNDIGGAQRPRASTRS